jgi:hypothetical protein
MASLLEFSIDGKAADSIIITSMNLNLERTSSGGIPTSGIQQGIIIFEMALEAETDDDTFFAAWLAQKTTTHTVDINCKHLADGTKYLTMKLEQASCIGYNVNYTFESGLDSQPENAPVTVTIASPKITIGQAPITLP